MIYFTADTHFFHRNIIDYSGRPFRSVESMNRSLIYRWNSTVTSEDLVYHLGDFGMGDKDLWALVVGQLNGRKILVLGNHDLVGKVTNDEGRRLHWRDQRRLKVDRSAEFMLSIGFEQVHENIIVEIDGVRVWMNHYPLESHDARDLKRPAPPGPYDLAVCGHVHQNFKVRGGVVNVGIDAWNYRPVTLSEILKRRAQGDH